MKVVVEIVSKIAAMSLLAAADICFQKQYSIDEDFAKTTALKFEDVSDIAINKKAQHLLVLQRSHPPVSVWSTNGTLLFVWDTQEIGYPHSLTIDHTTSKTTVWITDMAGDLAAGEAYGHCIKQFTYIGKFIQSIGHCGYNTNGSGIDPVEFDRVTDLAINSMGNIYVTDGDIGGINNRVLVFDPNHNLIDVWNKENNPGSAPLQFNLPHSIRIDWCDRIWITDTQNHRIQIISSNGTFLGEWKCFETSLLYGIDISSSSGYVVITAKTIAGSSEVIFLPIEVNAYDCSKLTNFGNCTIRRRLVVKQDINSGKQLLATSAMLHSVTVDNATGSLFLAMLPGSLPPLKYSPAPLPPRSDVSVCSGADNPHPWPRIWSSNVLLTPFFADDLHTARVQYNSDLQAMYIVLYGPSGKDAEYLNIADSTYIITRNSTTVTCFGPQNYGWSTPSRDWLAAYKCDCKGALNISGIETVAWTCPTYNLRNWYWMHAGNGSAWRMLFNNQSNPTRLPVLGEYTMAHFSDYGDEAKQLEIMYQICIGTIKMPNNSIINKKVDPINGFTYTECANISFPNWPEFFHMTVTMIPVVLNHATPFPTQVLYDWEIESQRTIMCEQSQTYNAYLIHNNTYVLNQNLATGAILCIARFNFGPPKPNWMTLDRCKCKGTITDNPALTPWHKTVIAVCPLSENRVFWTWFTEDVGFTPLLFFETLTPANEGTGLALADYHTIHKGTVLIDMQEFEVPSECQVS